MVTDIKSPLSENTRNVVKVRQSIGPFLFPYNHESIHPINNYHYFPLNLTSYKPGNSFLAAV